MDEAIWSTHFARQIAQKLGYGPPDAPPGARGIDFGPEVEALVSAMAAVFRYLPPEQIRAVMDFAEFLHAKCLDECPSPRRLALMAEKLHEVHDLAQFLRPRYGYDQPADEKDYWTDEDRRDCTLASIDRWDEREASEGDW